MNLRGAAPVLVGVAAGTGIAALAGFDPGAWRAPVMGAAAGSLALAVARLAGLARREWRHDRPPGRAYLGVVGPLVAALVLAGLATG